jgi:hypothetical protein
LLAAANTAIIVFTAATLVVISTLFVFALREMEEEHLTGSAYQGEPMLVDGLEQGLPFPHVVGEDGQHTVQLIDM